MENKITPEIVAEWTIRYPLMEQIIRMQEVFWVNPEVCNCSNRTISDQLGIADIETAEDRLTRFAPYIMQAFPETRQNHGIIESSLLRIDKMQAKLEKIAGHSIPGKIYMKCDNHLPISGSIKARGGIYEVLKLAESIAMKNGMLSERDNYTILASERFKELFSQYSIVVGSTGNLGLSIGIMSAALGFKATVHMSADAKQWKKDLLRAKGVIVVEHTSDYGEAVKAGRREAQLAAKSHFVDDEKSLDLFLGYAVAAKRLKQQLDELSIVVDEEHPMFVYLPCGVGGGPGGVTFGLRTLFQDNVHCFFAEPTHSPAMLLGLMTKLHDEIAVQDVGIDNITDADGLAVGRPSRLVGKLLEKDISGVFTVQDEKLYKLLRLLADAEDLYLEPSALAGFTGPVQLNSDPLGKKYLEINNLTDKMQNATYIVWATGGNMVPKEVMQNFYAQGE